VFKRIVIANDGSPGGFRALSLACDVAKRYGASLHMISVEELTNIPASVDEVIETKMEENHKFHDVLAETRVIAKKKGIKIHAEVVAGHAVTAIIAHVKAKRSRSSHRRVHGAFRSL